MPRGSKEHEDEVVRFLNELENKGYRTINLYGKSPDGVVVKDGKICAVEILAKIKLERKNYVPGSHHGRYVTKFTGGVTMRQKKDNYDMFDDVLFSTFLLKSSKNKNFPDGRKLRIKDTRWQRRNKIQA